MNLKKAVCIQTKATIIVVYHAPSSNDAQTIFDSNDKTHINQIMR